MGAVQFIVELFKQRRIYCQRRSVVGLGSYMHFKMSLRSNSILTRWEMYMY
jgi:hypothetical protein